MDKQDSKILTELTELKDKFNQIKTILSEDITQVAKQVNDKVELDTYEYTVEENQVVTEIGEIVDDIINALDEFYKYSDDDLDKLILE